ncbi:MAG TPA: Glu/Leu/Phe/Val dehydrogenase dimerization domain-containing protein, partial [Chlamydiales bacterium]|nr:Glu/Leu/Phe/Val dehydrogenase dimerization domain-containing protein [Chlamydiales bacterium]
MNFSLSTESEATTLESIQVEGFEHVFKVTNPKVKLTAIISIHSTALGATGLGGTRIQPYPSFEIALEDALRLSQAMTYKSAIAGVGYGGAKSVIIADPVKQKTPELLRAFADAVQKLQGRYVCAEDVGSNLEDMRTFLERTPYVVGTPHPKSSGNPSPFTAWGIFRGIQATLKKRFGSDSVEGKKIAVQGLGTVGSSLIDTLFWAGAELILSDIDMKKAEIFGKKYHAQVVDPEKILSVECDLLAPCALGGILNRDTIPNLRCKAVAGAANNQLRADSDANLLRERSILYAPDFVINAGGLINVAEELEKSGY